MPIDKSDPLAAEQFYRSEIKFVKDRIAHFATELDIMPDMKKGLANATLRQIEKLEQRFEDSLAELELLVPGEKDKSISVYDDLNKLEGKYLQRLADIESFDETTRFETARNSTMIPPTVPRMLFPKMPELALPRFDGSRKEWVPYKKFMTDIFENQPDLQDIYKYQYLKASCIGGKAKDIVLAVRDSNYKSAWENLCKSYDNDVLVKYIIVEELYNIPVPKENDHETLQKFINIVTNNVNYLKTMKVNTDEWNLLLGYHLMKRMDRATQVEFEKYRKIEEIVTVKSLIDFLENRVRVLEVAASTSVNTSKPGSTSYSNSDDSKKKSYPPKQFTKKTTITEPRKCGFCGEDHSVMSCPTLKDLSPTEIKAKARSLQLCFNCFKPDHRVQACQSSYGCSKCGSKLHHTLIHAFDQGLPNKFTKAQEPKQYSHGSIEQRNEEDPSIPVTEEVEITKATTSSYGGKIVLATAVIWIRMANGTQVPCRAFLDSGSTVNFITTKLAQKLRLPISKTHVTVEGVNCHESRNNQKLTATIQSRTTEYSMELEFLLSKKITSDLPTQRVDNYNLELPSCCQLADPLFNEPGLVDVLLGAEVFFSILMVEKTRLSNGLWLYESEFGYIIAGKTDQERPNKQVSLTAISELHDQIRKFWEIESCSIDMGLSIEEKAVENHYVSNVERLDDGRYQLALPFNDKVTKLGESSSQTLQICLATERRLMKNKEKKQHYDEFMNEMLELGHMERTTDFSFPHYFMTHHMIERPTSTTTKYRVVFNASKKTKSGLSLNDVLMVGPTIQNDVFYHLLRYREYSVVLIADITKMYRQIWVKPDERKYQLIWWRPNNSPEAYAYQLKTVTYGTASAPFSAIRTLKQLAYDEFYQYPDVTEYLLNNFYVDDFVISCIDENYAARIKNRMTELLNRGGFELRKWASNVPSLADELTVNESTTTVLGVKWKKDTDDIIIDFSYMKIHPQITKASVLSEISQFFDPLGLATPIVLKAKCFMQKLWEEVNLSWPDELPSELANEWLNFRNELVTNPPIICSRNLLTSADTIFSLHGFADASDVGYGSCIYLVTPTYSRLICAKSRVSPLKRLTTPRLELIAAVLLAKLMKKVIHSLRSQPENIYYWSDSEITIYRIKSAASKYNQFVSTRLAEIQDSSSPSDWRHIPSAQNPADVASRGLSPNELVNKPLWWFGPEFLLKSTENWPNQSKFDEKIINNDELELKKVVSTVITSKIVSKSDELALNSSSWKKLKSAIAYCIRFMLNAKKPRKYRDFSSLNLQELQDAELRLVKMMQQDYFVNEIRQLNRDNTVGKDSCLLRLNPFIDDIGLIRVGGRLSNSNLCFDEQHQIIIPSCNLSKLLLIYLHERNLHCGPQALLNASRRQYWILHARSTCRLVVQKCITCFKNKPVLRKQIMGNLPKHRVVPARPFQNVGIDFAGPFFLRPMPRAKTTVKTYVAIFKCFVTCAVHLEVVPDLSTKTFLKAFRRFIARRGLPSYVNTDNATNFIGARNEIQELLDLFLKKDNLESIKRFCTENEILWHTIPARSPHFGGLWESAVKQMKYHLKRVTKDKVFYPDDFQTLVCQIEAQLNSRPLTPTSNNPDDLLPITPGHYLIGTPLNALPEPDWSDISQNRLEQWQEIQLLRSKLWTRFQYDYLHQLQQRAKWNVNEPDVELNTLVMIYDEDLPPNQWKMGRILKTYRGTDNKIRVVDLKTADGMLKRSITKVAPLPLDD